MASLILVTVAFWGIISYYNNKKYYYLIALFLVFSCFIYLLPKTLFMEDLVLVMAFAVIPYELIKGKNLFSVKNDPVGKAIIVILLYYLIEVIWTVVQGRETLAFAMKVYRRDLFYLFYFIFRELKLSDVEKVYKPLLILTIIGGILYYLQFVGIHILADASDDADVAADGIARFLNTPVLSLPFLIYFLVKNGRVSFVLLLFFIGLLIMPMSRGIIIATFIAFLLYVFISGKAKTYKGMFIKFLVLFLIYAPVLLFRFVKDNDRGTAAQDLRAASSITDFAEFDYSAGGTFTFRIAMVLERVDYMMNHPEYLITGVGAIHEQSPNNRFEFYIGTNFTDADGFRKRLSIDTEDISYVTRFFRFGIVYLFLFGRFIYLSFKRFRKYMNDNAFGAVGFIVFLCLLINSLAADVYSFLRVMFVPLLCLAVLWKNSDNRLEEVYPIK